MLSKQASYPIKYDKFTDWKNVGFLKNFQLDLAEVVQFQYQANFQVHSACSYRLEAIK